MCAAPWAVAAAIAAASHCAADRGAAFATCGTAAGVVGAGDFDPRVKKNPAPPATTSAAATNMATSPRDAEGRGGRRVGAASGKMVEVTLSHRPTEPRT